MVVFMITGSPGVGKTTLTKKIADQLRSKGCHVAGFVTVENRGKEGRARVGFDLVDLWQCEERPEKSPEKFSRIHEFLFQRRIRIILNEISVNAPQFF